MRKIILYILVFSLALQVSAQVGGKADTSKFSYLLLHRFNANPSGKVYIDYKSAIASANELYANGEYDSCIALIQYSLKGAGSKMMDREVLLEILVECYLEKDDLENADRAVVRLLTNDPNYELNEEAGYSEDFNRLVNKYEVFPCFSIGVRNTQIKSSYTTTKNYSLPNNPGINYNTPYTSNFSWYTMYYGWMEYEFKKDWSINAEAIRYNIGYNRLLQNDTSGYTSYEETMLIYRMPLYLRRYAHIGRRISCYAGLGFSFDYISAAVAHAEYYVFSKNIVQNADLDVLNLKHQGNVEWLVAGGAGYTIKRLRIFLDARYYGGITSLTNPAINNSMLASSYHYIDNGVKLNQFEFGASASITLSYKAKRKK